MISIFNHQSGITDTVYEKGPKRTTVLGTKIKSDYLDKFNDDSKNTKYQHKITARQVIR